MIVLAYIDYTSLWSHLCGATLRTQYNTLAVVPLHGLEHYTVIEIQPAKDGTLAATISWGQSDKLIGGPSVRHVMFDAKLVQISKYYSNFAPVDFTSSTEIF